MEILNHLSDQEKIMVQPSLIIIDKNMDFFVIRFFDYFLRTKANKIFQQKDKESQFDLFIESIKIIFSRIANKEEIEKNLEELVKKHKDLGITKEHVNYFKESFLNALNEIFANNADKKIIEIWDGIISEILFNFNRRLDQIILY